MSTIPPARSVEMRGWRAALVWEPPIPRLAAVLDSTPFLGAILFFLTVPYIVVLPSTGPDASWQAGLYMAVEHGSQFGRDFVFTYGPLGFLHYPVLYGEGLFVASLVFVLGIHLLAGISLLRVIRRALPLPLALATCYVLLTVGHLNSAVVMVAFIWAFASVGPEAHRRAGLLLAFGGGALAAVELLAKLNYGITIFALCLVALAALPRRCRHLPLFAATFGCSLLALWKITDQAIANLPAYLANSLQVVSGYSESMGIDTDPRAHEVTLALIAAGLLLAAGAVITRRDRRLTRIASLLILAIFLFACFKQDYIRRALDGRSDFALMATVAALAVASRLPKRGQLPRTGAVVALVAPMLLLVVWTNPPPSSLLQEMRPGDHVTALREDLKLATDPSRRAGEREGAREGLRTAYALPPTLLRQIGDRGIAIEPWEIGVAWAYGLNWRPLPVIQDYANYTPALVRLDVETLEGRDGPPLILRQADRGIGWTAEDGIAGPYPNWDGAAAKLAVLCNYREVGAGGQWLLLEKTADRCGEERLLGSVASETGAVVHVPPAPRGAEIVFAKIAGLGADLGEKVATLAYRGPAGWVSFDDGPRWDMVRATAGDGLILSAPDTVDYRDPFRMAPDAASFRVGIDGSGPRPITVSWYAESVEPRRAGHPPRAAITN